MAAPEKMLQTGKRTPPARGPDRNDEGISLLQQVLIFCPAALRNHSEIY
jgi:hypothetical protein